MAKLYFKYGAMTAGKTIDVITTAYKYNSREMHAIIIKPKIDTKANDYVASRIGLYKRANLILDENDSIIEKIKKYENLRCIVIDEAQFLTERQVYELVIITKQLDVPVICFGLKVDFQGKLFEGSDALLRYADSLEELTAICNCGKKARFNARKIDNEYTFDGEQVLIGADESYEPLCEKCFLEKVLIPHSKEFQKILTKE